MSLRPSPRSTSMVLFLSFSVFMTCLVGVLLLAACSTTEKSPVLPEPVVVDQPQRMEIPPIATPPAVLADPAKGVVPVVLPSTGEVAFDTAHVEATNSRGWAKLNERMRDSSAFGHSGAPPFVVMPQPRWNTERYDELSEVGFVRPQDDPLSTFSVDVDTASYANIRRFLRENVRPPAGAVRIEELVNYFRYPSRVQPGEGPFEVDLEIFDAPWREEHRLVRIAVEGRDLSPAAVPPRNLVFLLDVSGSMQGPDRLDLVKYGMERLTESLRPIDRVSIVVYAGASGLVLPPTSGNDEETIVAALDRLQAGGSTAGAAGIRLAYETARESFVEGGINRVLLATDGDFNVGTASRSDLVELIERERESGVFLTVLGFGRGNLNDAAMEQLADHGNGNYAYIDGRGEARKVLVEQANATLVTIAKDVKIQVEFNPRRVKAYRLIGYENRALADQDFNDDTKDAGEIGAGHHVTALYEIVPVEAKGGAPGGSVDPLKYQAEPVLTEAAASAEWLTVRLRYKEPDGAESRLVSASLAGAPGEVRTASENARFSTAVALFGMLLRDSEFKGAGGYPMVEALAKDALGPDEHGERAEFLQLVKLAGKL